MRSYMPGPHRRFLQELTSVANIRDFVESHSADRALTIAYDACLHMLRTFRDKHIQIVSRYIIIQAKEARKQPSAKLSTNVNGNNVESHTSKEANISLVRDTNRPIRQGLARTNTKAPGALRGTGGTALIPFLKQARDETGEPSIGSWAQRLLTNTPGALSREHGDFKIQGLAGQWLDSEDVGGLCHW